jgi:hypothetical protein
MTSANNILNSSVPSLAAIQHRRRELLAYQAGQRQAQATAEPEEPLAAEDSCLQQEDRLGQISEALEAPEELQESEDSEEPYPVEDVGPPPTAPAPPILAESALHGLAGLAVRSLRLTRKPIPLPSSCNSGPPSATWSARASLHSRLHSSRPQPLRRIGGRIQQGPQRNQLASDR